MYLFPLDQEVETDLFFGKFFFKLTDGVKLVIFVTSKDGAMWADLDFVSHADDI